MNWGTSGLHIFLDNLTILCGKTHGNLRIDFPFISSVTNIQVTFSIPGPGVPMLNRLYIKLFFSGRSQTIVLRVFIAYHFLVVGP